MPRLGEKFPGAGCHNLIPQSQLFPLHPPTPSTPSASFSLLLPLPQQSSLEVGPEPLSPLFSPVPLHRVPCSLSLLSHLLSAASLPKFGLILVR